jgi:hypothetical protein
LPGHGANPQASAIDIRGIPDRRVGLDEKRAGHQRIRFGEVHLLGALGFVRQKPDIGLSAPHLSDDSRGIRLGHQREWHDATARKLTNQVRRWSGHGACLGIDAR